MDDLNGITISGNLTRNPESRGEGTVAGLRIGSNRSFRRNGSEEWEQAATFVSVTCFKGVAKMALAKLQKGDKVVVQGRLEQNDWKAKDGSDRSELRIVANGIQAEGFYRPSDYVVPADDVETKGMEATTAKEGGDEQPEGDVVPEGDIPF
jgi:single-strand DNA-binding protein